MDNRHSTRAKGAHPRRHRNLLNPAQGFPCPTHNQDSLPGDHYSTNDLLQALPAFLPTTAHFSTLTTYPDPPTANADTLTVHSHPHTTHQDTPTALNTQSIDSDLVANMMWEDLDEPQSIQDLVDYVVNNDSYDGAKWNLANEAGDRDESNQEIQENQWNQDLQKNQESQWNQDQWNQDRQWNQDQWNQDRQWNQDQWNHRDLQNNSVTLLGMSRPADASPALPLHQNCTYIDESGASAMPLYQDSFLCSNGTSSLPLYQDASQSNPGASTLPLYQDTVLGIPGISALPQQPMGATQGTRKGFKHYHTRMYLPDGPEKEQRRRLLNNEASNRRNKKMKQQQKELEQQMQELQQENTRLHAVQQLLPSVNRRLVQMLTDKLASHQASSPE